MEQVCCLDPFLSFLPWLIINQVCADYRIALQYDWTVIQDYDIIDHIDPIRKDDKDWPLYINSDLDFDNESIMLYTSSEFAADGLDTDDPLQVPLAFWKHRGIGYEPPEMVGADDVEIIDVRWRVGAGDYEGVKHLYPWVGLDEAGKELGGQGERERQRLGGSKPKPTTR
jgi:hypothetical protein